MVPHLLFHVDDRRSVLQQQRPESVTEIVQTNLTNASLGQHRKEYPMVEVVRVDYQPLVESKNEIV